MKDAELPAQGSDQPLTLDEVRAKMREAGDRADALYGTGPKSDVIDPHDEKRRIEFVREVYGPDRRGRG